MSELARRTSRSAPHSVSDRALASIAQLADARARNTRQQESTNDEGRSRTIRRRFPTPHRGPYPRGYGVQTTERTSTRCRNTARSEVADRARARRCRRRPHRMSSQQPSPRPVPSSDARALRWTGGASTVARSRLPTHGRRPGAQPPPIAATLVSSEAFCERTGSTLERWRQHHRSGRWSQVAAGGTRAI